MKKSTAATIYATTSYDAFEVDITNRGIGSLAKLKKSMRRYGFLDAHPIHVVRDGSKLIIRDGQHRFASARALGIPVKYVVCANSDISISEINNAQRGWSIKNHVESMANKGDANYQYLLQFSTAHNLPLGISAALLCASDVKHGVGNKIRGGTFAATCTEHAERVAMVVKIARHHFRYATHSLFIDALRRCLGIKGFDANRLVKKMQSHPGLMINQPSIDGFLSMLEALYNYRSSEKLPVAFLAKNQ